MRTDPQPQTVNQKPEILYPKTLKPQNQSRARFSLNVHMYMYIYIYIYMGGCQNYGPFLGTLNIRGRIIMGIQKGTIILTTTHIYLYRGFRVGKLMWGPKQFTKEIAVGFWGMLYYNA